MKTATTAEIESHFSNYLKASETEPVLVTRDGRPVAIIVGIQNQDELQQLPEVAPPQLQAILTESRSQVHSGETLTHEEFWKQIAHNRDKAE